MTEGDYSPGINAGASTGWRPTACNPKLSMFLAAQGAEQPENYVFETNATAKGWGINPEDFDN